MKASSTNQIHFTPWHLRDRTRTLKRDLSKTIQSNFFYSFLFLPKYKREAIIDVYNFCRAIDDVVDDADALWEHDPQVELNKWRKELDNLYAGQPTWHQTHKLQRTLKRFPIEKNLFEKLVYGCEIDLYKKRYETFDDLREYCYHVASVVGLMCIEIFTYQSPRTREYAENLGLALQLTNILRDLKEDAERDRVYLPQEDLRRFDYSERELMNGVVNDNFRALMKFECDRAHAFYRKAAECLPAEDRPTLVAAQTMGRIYFRLLQKIESVNYDVFNHRIRLHRPTRFLIALQEWGRR
ncbi:MAG: presqualene diphosphate synthase HpnD [Acidobacteria bacterium]|nr:presqualene diphosphate synthase HpnD [Acidobacteriota bacterium]